jgi:Tfp pilus assembly protein PilE
MDKKGIALIELAVVLSVVVVLIASAGFSYEKWVAN